MSDIFPALRRRFEADPKCVRHCRKLYELGEDVKQPKAYARWSENGGENLDGFNVDIEEHQGEFTLHSEDVTPKAVRNMANAIIRAFDDKVLYQGGFSRIDSHRTGPAIIAHDDGVYTATIPYTVYAVQETQVPAVIG